MCSSPERPRYFSWEAALILLAGFWLRIWRLGDASLWFDEAVTDFWLRSSLDRFYVLVLESGTELPLYFSLMRPLPTHTEWLIRWPSVLLGVLGIALLMWVVMRLYCDFNFALLAGALLAFNPYHVWLSRTARPYTLFFVVALLASYFFLKLLNGERSRANWASFILSSMAAYLTHYFSVGLPLAQYVLFAFILRGNRGFFRRWIGAQAIAAFPVFLWIFALSQQAVVSLGIGWIPHPGVDDIPITVWNMTLGYDGAFSWYVACGLVALASGLLPGLYWAIRERGTDRVHFYWMWLIVAPLLLAFVVSIFRPVYVDRYFMFLLPAILLLTIHGWMRLPQQRWRMALAAVVILVGTANILLTILRGEDEKEAWRSVAAFVDHERQPDDGLLTETPITLVVFLRYADDDLERGWLLGVDDLASQYEEPVKRLWVVYRNPKEDGHRQGVLEDFDPFEPSISPLPNWLNERHDRVLLQKEFNGVTVLLVELGDEFVEAED